MAGPCTLDPTQAYRLHVYATNAVGAEVELGFADVTVVPLPKPHQPAPSVDLNNYSPLVQNLPYIIAFRIEQGVVHDWRHTFAVDALKRGVSPVVVATQLGHHDATLVLKRYGRYVPNIDELLKSIAVESTNAIRRRAVRAQRGRSA